MYSELLDSHWIGIFSIDYSNLMMTGYFCFFVQDFVLTVNGELHKLLQLQNFVSFKLSSNSRMLSNTVLPL